MTEMKTAEEYRDRVLEAWARDGMVQGEAFALLTEMFAECQSNALEAAADILETDADTLTARANKNKDGAILAVSSRLYSLAARIRALKLKSPEAAKSAKQPKALEVLSTLMHLIHGKVLTLSLEPDPDDPGGKECAALQAAFDDAVVEAGILLKPDVSECRERTRPPKPAKEGG